MIEMAASGEAVQAVFLRVISTMIFIAVGAYFLIFHTPENAGKAENPTLFIFTMVILVPLICFVGYGAVRKAERTAACIDTDALWFLASNGVRHTARLRDVERMVLLRTRAGKPRQLNVHAGSATIRLFGLADLEGFAEAIARRAPNQVPVHTKTIRIDASSYVVFLACVVIVGGGYLWLRIGGVPLAAMNMIILPVAAVIGLAWLIGRRP